MVFPHAASVVSETFGYHPIQNDLDFVVNLVPVEKLLIIGRDVPDVISQVNDARYLYDSDLQLPIGIYWFGEQQVSVMVVTEGPSSGPGELVRTADVVPNDTLSVAAQWFQALWKRSIEISKPLFGIGDEVIVRTTGQDSVIRTRSFSSGVWLYDLRLDGRRQQLSEEQIELFPDDDDPMAWVATSPASAERFAATLTRAKLEGSLSDTVFSFRATRTIFRPYQFKPIIKLLETGKSRLLIADEVGLGKTIEAGLVWTELEARGNADRVLIISPSSLVAKWRSEMDERFNFNLVELSGQNLKDFEEKARVGRLPKRGAYIGSLERLRKWDALDELSELIETFDLIVFDEAHYLRNVGTKSNALGALLGEMTDNMVFLSATPLNLKSEDLFNLLDLLSPGEFGDAQSLDDQLQPNAVLNRLSESLADIGVTADERISLLNSLEELTFGAPLLTRIETELLAEILQRDILDPADVVRAKRLIADLNALSAVVTRTRKVEVDEKKAIRDPKMVSVRWSPIEETFYGEYYSWCKARAELAGTPIGFSMQMPLRLASACLPAARDAVLSWESDVNAPLDEDSSSGHTSVKSSLAPHKELLDAAHALGEQDSKLSELVEQVLELLGQKKQALLFTFSRPTLDYLKTHLSKFARVAVMHGGVSKETRRQIMSQFREGAYDLVLANKVASEGLDFEFCSTVINYDLPWNPMEIEQRIGRIDRIGQQEEKMIIINFFNESTIDESILSKVLLRIGIFERSIGALEPIIQSKLTDIEQALLDFSLTHQQREFKLNQAMEAIEAQSAGVEEFSSAASFLLTSNDVDVSGMEEDLVRTGKYVGPMELVHLLDDWSATVGGSRVIVSSDGKSVSLRGNARMAEQVRALVAAGKRSTIEVQETISTLQSEVELTLVLDQELARTAGGDLLTATHPLVLAALTVPGFQNTRYSSLAVPKRESSVALGRYFLQLAVAEWTGVRAGREIWGAAVDSQGNEVSGEVVDLLLASLATGSIVDGWEQNLAISETEGVLRTSQALNRRHVIEAQRREREASALTEARRISTEQLHKRKLDSIESRINTAHSRGNLSVLPAFKAQRNKVVQRNAELLRKIDESLNVSMLLRSLAVCEVEVFSD